MSNSSPPRYLVYWINSIPSTRCALCNGTVDLLDGHILIDVTEHVLGSPVPFAETSETAAGRVRAVLCLFGDRAGKRDAAFAAVPALPKELLTADAADEVAKVRAALLSQRRARPMYQLIFPLCLSPYPHIRTTGQPASPARPPRTSLQRLACEQSGQGGKQCGVGLPHLFENETGDQQQH